MKKFIAFSVLALGILASVYIAGMDFASNASQSGVSFRRQGSATPSSNLSFQSNSPSSNPAFSDAPVSNAGSPSEDNFTDAIAKQYIQQVYEKNKTAVQNGNTSNLLVPNEKNMETSMAAIFKQDVSSRFYTEKDIRVANDDSSASQITYIQSFQKILHTQIAPVPVNTFEAIQNFFDKNDADGLSLLSDATSRVLSDLLSLPVPPSLVAIHLQLLNLWERQHASYVAILALQEDPAKAYLALQKIASFVQEDINLQTALIQHASDLRS